MKKAGLEVNFWVQSFLFIRKLSSYFLYKKTRIYKKKIYLKNILILILTFIKKYSINLLNKN